MEGAGVVLGFWWELAPTRLARGSVSGRELRIILNHSIKE
jgi:hypothetical protein